MKPFVLLIALLFGGIVASAEDALMSGGRSPDGLHEVRIYHLVNADTPEISYAIRICTAPKRKRLFTISDIGGYLDYGAAIERDRALWHASSKFVVISDHDTRHSREFYVFEVVDGHVDRLQLPDYAQNAFGRVNATSVDFAFVPTPKRWDGDDLVVDLYFTANQRRHYNCEVVLHLSHVEGGNSPSIYLKSVSNPTEE